MDILHKKVSLDMLKELRLNLKKDTELVKVILERQQDEHMKQKVEKNFGPNQSRHSVV